MKRVLALVAALVTCAAAAATPAIPGPLRMLGAAGVVLVIPGLAWLGLLSGRPLSPARLAVAVVSFACVSALVGLAATAVLGAPPSPWPFLIWTAVGTTAGAGVTGPWPKLEPGARWGRLAAVAGLGFLAASLAALHLVPPLEDHDMEVRGTAYGLASTGKPYFTSNRSVYLPMSHPVLFNVLVADSLLVTREIDATRPSYESARRAEGAEARGEPFPWDEQWHADYRAFLERPALVGTRAPSAFFAALILALLFDLVARLPVGAPGAWLACAVYVTAPETIVRSAYAGYFGETVFAMLAAVAVFAEEGLPRAGAWLLASGALMALLDHKTVLLVMAVAAWYGARALVARERLEPRAVALTLGFAAGTLAWWSYGFWVSARVFVRDHLRAHIAHRILLNDVRFAHDTVNHYAPSIPEVWREFAAHTGWALVPVALVATIHALVRPRNERLVLLALWASSGALAYSLVDWRQTKHLMNGLVPMTALAVALAAPSVRAAGSSAARAARVVLLALLAAGTLVNLATDARLLRDFTSLTISGASDVDGW